MNEYLCVTVRVGNSLFYIEKNQISFLMAL